MIENPSNDLQNVFDQHILFWKLIGGEILAGGHELLLGDYQLVGVREYAEYDSIPHLINTHWDQFWPYNSCCPYGADNVHRPAGCAAITTAQVLNYLNNFWSQNINIPGICTNVDIPTFDNYSSSVWNDIATNSANAAPLIREIGRELNMMYFYDSNNDGIPDGARSYSNMIAPCFAYYGIRCDYIGYNSSTITANLTNGKPSIIDLQGTYYGIAHSAIIDRYMRSRIVTQFDYEWVYNNTDPSVILPYVQPYSTYTYSSPVVVKYGLRWGLDPYTVYDSMWFVTDISEIWQIESLTYGSNSKIITNFEVL